MTLEYENETGASEPFDLKALAVKVADAVLDEVGCPYEACASLLVTGDDEIRQINRDMRGIDSVTDVLSFPMIPFDNAGDFSVLDDPSADAECFDPESGELLLGDMVVDLTRCREQAAGYGHSVKREFAFLIAHSMLHLTGYDHMTPPEEEEMCALQEKILTGLGIGRDITDDYSVSSDATDY